MAAEQSDTSTTTIFLHGGMEYLGSCGSTRVKSHIVTSMEVFAEAVKGNFDQICKDLVTNVSATDCNKKVEFYDKNCDIGDTEEPLVLTGLKMLVCQSDPDFTDHFEEISRELNLYATVQDYNHEEGDHARFERFGDTSVAGVGFSCVLKVEYHYGFSEEQCADLLGLDDKYGCCAVVYNFSIYFREFSSERAVKKRKNCEDE